MRGDFSSYWAGSCWPRWAPNDLALLHASDLCFVPKGSILESEGAVPENAILTVRCEEASIADVVKILEEM